MNKSAAALLNREAVILLVDDQEPNVRLVGTMLSQAGFNVVPAMTGEQALSRALASPPDLVLLDLMMPGMDGVEVAHRLRDEASTAHVPVIFLTATHEHAQLLRAFDNGAVDFVTKPFVAEELLARVRTHVELKLMRDHLRLVAQEREELAAIVAHDLKNPLSSIRFTAQLLARKDEPDARTTQLAQLIEDSADRALNYIHHYLERRAEGELMRDFRPEAVVLAPMVRRVAERFTAPTQAKRIELRLELDEDVTASVDALALTQVLENLVSNAIKFSPAGGEVLVRCGRALGGRVRVDVLDRGPGISRADQQKLFQRYARLSTQPTGQESSTGLGLALAKQDVAQMRGHLWYEDRPNGGAIFAMELPEHR